MRIPFRKLRNLAKTTEALVVSAWLTRQGHPPSRRLVLPEQLTASLALPEPAAAIDEGAWRAAETIEALEGLTFGEEAIASPASIECFDISHFCGLQTVGASSAFDRGVLAPDRYGWYALSDGPPDDPAAIARSVTQRLEETDPPDLFVLDGGIAQLNAATRAVAAAGASTRRTRRPSASAASFQFKNATINLQWNRSINANNWRKIGAQSVSIDMRLWVFLGEL